MTSHACGTREVVATILRVVTVCALARGNGVRARQREIHHRMIKGCRRPRCRCMALGTVRGEVCCHVAGVGRTLEIFQVAANAGCRSQVVIVVGVAIGAQPRRNGMSSAKRKSHRIVIEVRAEPGVGGMAVFAGRGELRCDVVGIACGLELLGVARITLRRHRLEVARGRALMA